MRDMTSDWNRWSLAERIGAIMLFAAFVVISGASILGVLNS
jgi:hypothetical protein